MLLKEPSCLLVGLLRPGFEHCRFHIISRSTFSIIPEMRINALSKQCGSIKMEEHVPQSDANRIESINININIVISILLLLYFYSYCYIYYFFLKFFSFQSWKLLEKYLFCFGRRI